MGWVWGGGTTGRGSEEEQSQYLGGGTLKAKEGVDRVPALVPALLECASLMFPGSTSGETQHGE